MSDLPNKVVIRDGRVYRRAGPYTEQIHHYLKFLCSQNFQGIPIPLDFDNYGTEILSFIEGDTIDSPNSEEQLSSEHIISSAKLLRAYHDISEKYVEETNITETKWMFAQREPVEVICHNDFAPYNICYEGEKAVGIIDFDAAHPGPRLWDIAYAVYRFSPFFNYSCSESFGSVEQRVERARIFCASYGLDKLDLPKLAPLMIQRVDALLSFLKESAERGDSECKANILAGHHLKYQSDIEYISKNQTIIRKGLSKW